MHAPAKPFVDLTCDVAAAREAQTRWAQTPIGKRLRFIRHLRHAIAENAGTLAAELATIGNRPMAEKLTSEILPLADACQWLERQATRILATRKFGRRFRPFWLQGATFEVQRTPFGVFLVIGPKNYPLFLPAVHTLHALVAGNAVLWKPAPGTRAIALQFAQLLRSTGIDPALLLVLNDEVQAAHDAIGQGVDKVIFTGSSRNGRDLLAALARTNTPSVMELSGNDAVILLADADIDLVSRALEFGLRLNNGATCIAPRRLIVEEPLRATIRLCLPPELQAQLEIIGVSDREELVQLANATAHGLGASIFSRDLKAARTIAAQLRTGLVTINDLIVPTADPRLPFGGVKASGFGITRGAEGLLETTYPHVVAVRRGKTRWHLDKPKTADAELFTAFIRAAHGRGLRRARAMRDLLGTIWSRRKERP